MKAKDYLLAGILILSASLAHGGILMDIVALPGFGYNATLDGKGVLMGFNASPTIVMQVWATVTGTDNNFTNDGIHTIAGGIQLTHVQPSASALSLTDSTTKGYIAPFDTLKTSPVSVTSDLLGTAGATTQVNSLAYRAGLIQYTTAGNSRFLLGTFNFTADSGTNLGGFSTVNWVKAGSFLAGANFMIDGEPKNGLSTSGLPLISAGFPVVVYTWPEPSTFILLGMGGFGLLVWLWRRNRIAARKSRMG
ncbi:MAG: PEP-CTERM sorting domain-containing protein [Pirellulales bacterium]|nr:PEP-CTERM sorting domain-containing protein [Pirellulales bacterium]